MSNAPNINEQAADLNGERPCLPAGLAKEFDHHVRYLKGSIVSCGVDHAWGVARMLAGMCHDPERLMFHAILEHEVDRAMLAFVHIASKTKFHRETAPTGSNLALGLDEITALATARYVALNKARDAIAEASGGAA